MYNKQVRLYRKYDKADRYIVGFEYNAIVYIAVVKSLRSAWLFRMRESGKKTYKVQMRLTKKDKQKLINKGAMPVMNYGNFVTLGYNNGDSLERVIREHFGLKHQHDNLPFYKGVDISVNGVGYSIKWENAQICTYRTISKLENAEKAV